MQAQNKNIPSLEQIEQKRKQANVPKDEIALMQERNQLPSKSGETPKVLSKLSDERKKQLEVPKDQMAMMEQKRNSDKVEEESQDMSKQKGKELSSNCEQELPSIKEEKGMDLLDFDIEPLQVSPKLDSTASQQQFRKQLYMQNQKDRKHPVEHHELERKEQLKSQQSQRIMREMKKSDNKEIKQQGKDEMSKNKATNKNRGNEKQKHVKIDDNHRKENKA